MSQLTYEVNSFALVRPVPLFKFYLWQASLPSWQWLQPPPQLLHALPDFLLLISDLMLKPTMTTSTSRTIIVEAFIKSPLYAALRLFKATVLFKVSSFGAGLNNRYSIPANMTIAATVPIPNPPPAKRFQNW